MSNSKNSATAVFLRAQRTTGNERQDNLSPSQLSKKALKADLVVIEKEGKIEIVQGICATAILAKAQAGEYGHTILWPEITKRKSINKKFVIFVLKDLKGILSYIKNEDVKEFQNRILPEGYTIVFNPLIKK